MSEHGIGALLSIARAVAEEAAAGLLAGYRTRPNASEKAKSDLVTAYDVESEQLIRSRLSEHAPHVALVAEEGGGTSDGLTFYVDPLDGTTNFVHGHPFFAVSIGLMDGAAPVGGVIVAPALGLRWWGGVGIGAFRNDVPCSVSTVADASRALLATGFPPNRDVSPDNNFDTFTHVKRRVQGIRRCGSAAIDCCLVADGTYEGYWERRLNAWDLAAGCAIAVGAGARLTSLTGGPADLTVGHVVLSNGRIHAALVGMITDSVVPRRDT
jgi:myo-inositol-1(or 4)-monophosphatase